ncbi:hypothetical protein BH24PSE2_BH24PSE2_14840 [soil metagenome]
MNTHLPSGHVLLATLALALAACADSGPIIHGTFGKIFGRTSPADETAAPPVDETAAPAGVPAAVRKRVRADLAGRLEVSPERILTLSAEPATWEDTSLGCERLSGDSAIEGLIEGYRIVLSYASQRYDYRVQKAGPFVLCEQVVLR